MGTMIHLLHLEDNPADVALVKAKLMEAGLTFRITRVRTRDEFETALRDGETQIILADYRLPTYDGVSAMRLAKGLRPDLPFIFVSGTMGEEAAIEALTQGATDYVLKQNPARLAPAVRRALQEARNQHERRQAREALQRTNMINAARIHLMEFAAAHSLDELLEETANEAERLTESLIGFYHFVGDDQQALTLRNWSTHTKARFCETRGKGLHDPIADAGVWVDCVRERRPVVHNDSASPAHGRGMPEGHAGVVRELVVPVLRGEKIKAILGVGNKPADYTQRDVEAISLLADLAWGITENKRAQDQLNEQLHFLQQLIDSIPIPVNYKDPEGLYLGCNAAYEAFTGVSNKDIVGKPVHLAAKITHDPKTMERADKHREADLALLRHPGVQSYESSGLDKDGHHRDMVFTKATFVDANDCVAGIVTTVIDITAHKQAERLRLANLRFFESMDRVNRAIQGTNVLEQMMSDVLEAVLTIFDCDRAFIVYPCDPGAATWCVPMERCRPEYPGVFELGLEVPMDPDVARTMRLQLASDGPVKFGPDHPHPLPVAISDRLGIKCFMSMAIYPKQDRPWQFGIHQCSYARIWTEAEELLFHETGRRLADALTGLLAYRTLRQNEAKLAEAQRQAKIGNWELDLVSDALVWSDEIFRIFEIDPDRFDATYQAFLDAVHPDDREVVNAAYADSLNTKSPYDIEHRLLFSDGRIKYVHEQCETVFDADGRPIRSIGTAQDITERKRAEEALRDLTDQLEQRVRDRTVQLEAANKEMHAFTYTVSHDLRAPLRHINGFMELLQKKTGQALDEQGRHYMDAISQAAQKMGLLVDDLLSFSRMGRSSMSFKQLELEPLVREVIGELEPDAAGRAIDWRIGDLPTVHGDAALLRMVLTNLIANAVKFTRPREKARIEIGSLPGKTSETVIFVRDNGVGFDMTYVDKLFGVFQRLHRTEDFEGTGIGLATVHRIIARHGGRTWAEGQLNQGAAFYFSLPRSVQGA